MKKGKQQSLGPPPSDAVGQQRWLGQLQELVETAHGQRGDGKRAFVERQDLVGLNLADFGKQGFGGGTTQNVTLVTKVVAAGDTAVLGEVNDTAPPTPVRNVVAIGDNETNTKVIVLWDSTGIYNYGGAEVYRSNVDNFGTAAAVGSAGIGQRIFVDEFDRSTISGNVFYWVKAKKTSNRLLSPLNAALGTQAIFDLEQQQQALADAALTGYKIIVGLAADSALINNAWISSMIISNELKSDNYIPGQAGWILKK